MIDVNPRLLSAPLSALFLFVAALCSLLSLIGRYQQQISSNNILVAALLQN
jgi:hypothetical protein